MNQLSINIPQFKSRPAWARGLKLAAIPQQPLLAAVAPRLGAWIETIDDQVRLATAAGRAPRGRVD